MSTTPRIYIACLSSYNAGRLEGVWTECEDMDVVDEKIGALLRATGGEEYAIHDSEGFQGYAVGEHDDIEETCRIGRAIELHGPVLAAWLQYDREYHKVEDFEEAYRGAYDDLADFAHTEAEENGDLHDVPERYRNYIDWESIARDMKCNGDVYTIILDGLTHVFTST